MTARSCQSSRVLRHLYFTSGRHYWEVLVERVADPLGVVVGVAPSESIDTSDAIAQVIGYAATGVIRHSGVDVCRAQAYAVGDTVGVYLDMNAKQVAFFLNDEAQPQQRSDDRETLEEEERTCSYCGGYDMDLETKPPVGTELRAATWFSFRSRAVFAALETSTDADKLVVVGAELPGGYG
ncbi:hypothetical protein PHYBOEH_003749 [Phytophthora boehmeriae]|uniref:B30.2/SPRY domain-containing protein n=1 Tax=Phytophthora boehmeriae TaxID=109152 RepID=A0A8T1WU69_9STRA|nr:hypothetical protein PHYBOEH_003749 [Phytophthora boehmeriae]